MPLLDVCLGCYRCLHPAISTDALHRRRQGLPGEHADSAPTMLTAAKARSNRRASVIGCNRAHIPFPRPPQRTPHVQLQECPHAHLPCPTATIPDPCFPPAPFAAPSSRASGAGAQARPRRRPGRHRGALGAGRRRPPRLRPRGPGGHRTAHLPGGNWGGPCAMHAGEIDVSHGAL